MDHPKTQHIQQNSEVFAQEKKCSEEMCVVNASRNLRHFSTRKKFSLEKFRKEAYGKMEKPISIGIGGEKLLS